MSAHPSSKWLLPCALLALSACGEAPSDASPASNGTAEVAPVGSREEGSGTLAFELKTADGITLNAFNYSITGPNFSKVGTIDVSKSNTVSARIDALPAASGYSVTVLGNSVGEPVAQCTGSASFDIAARTVTNLPITISCHEERVDAPVAAPLPRSSTWLCGLALLGLGITLVQRSGSKRRG